MGSPRRARRTTLGVSKGDHMTAHHIISYSSIKYYDPLDPYTYTPQNPHPFIPTKTYMPHAMTMSVTHPTFSWSTILQMCGWIAAETSGRGGVLRRENIRSWHATSIPGLTRSPRTKCWYLCLQREKRGGDDGRGGKGECIKTPCMCG